MHVKINYRNKSLNFKNSNLILFVDEKFNLSGVKKYFSSSEYSFVSDLIKTKDLEKKILTFDISSVTFDSTNKSNKRSDRDAVRNKINALPKTVPTKLDCFKLKKWLLCENIQMNFLHFNNVKFVPKKKKTRKFI